MHRKEECGLTPKQAAEQPAHAAAKQPAAARAAWLRARYATQATQHRHHRAQAAAAHVRARGGRAATQTAQQAPEHLDRIGLAQEHRDAIRTLLRGNAPVTAGGRVTKD